MNINPIDSQALFIIDKQDFLANLKTKQKSRQIQTNSYVNYTFGTSIKLGLAVEMSPKVFSEQFTNCERMSHAASADSVLLSTWQAQTKIASHLKMVLKQNQNTDCNARLYIFKTVFPLTLKLTYCRWLECLFMICLMRSGCVAFR